MPIFNLSDGPPACATELRRAADDANQPDWIVLAGRDRISKVDFRVMLNYALPMSLRLPIGDVCTAEYLIDGALWVATSDGVHRYFGRVISYMVNRGLLPLEPVGSDCGTRLYRRTKQRKEDARVLAVAPHPISGE